MSRSPEILGEVNLIDIFRGMARRKLLLIALPLLAVCAGLAFVKVSKPKYQAEAQIVVENLATPFDRSQSVQEPAQPDNLVTDRMVASQVSILKSQDIAARVVDQLGLDGKPEYNIKMKPRGRLASVAIPLGFMDDPSLFTDKALAAKSLTAGLTIYQIPESNVIGIKSVSTDPDLAANTANAVAETYVLSTHEVGGDANERARAWLSQQIADLRSKVADSENAVEKYRSEAGLLKGTSSTLGTQQISELNSQIAVADGAKAEAQAKAKEIKALLSSQSELDASSDVLASPVFQSLREQQVIAQRNISELSATYLPNHPKMIAAQKQLSTVDQQVRIEAKRVADSLQNQAKVADQRSATLRAQLDALKNTETEANFSDVKLQALERDATANRALLQTMLDRYAEANAKQDVGLQPGMARVIQKATAPSVPYFPKMGPIVVLSLLAGLALGMGLAFVLELLSPSVTPAVVESEPRHHTLSSRSLQEVAVPDMDVTGDAPAEAAPAPLDELARKAPLLDKEAVADAAPVETPAPVASPLPMVQTTAAPTSAPAQATLFGSMPGALTLSRAVSMLAEHSEGDRGTLHQGADKLASAMLGLRDTQNCLSFAIASIGSAIPNSAIALIATARELARRGEKVIAIDLSPSPVNIERLLALQPGPGLVELANGTADFSKIVARDRASDMHVIRMGQVSGGVPLQAIIQQLGSIQNALKTIYDVILLHVGEIQQSNMDSLGTADAAIILAPQPRLSDAHAATHALQHEYGNKAFVMKLDPERQPQQTAATAS